MTDSTVLPEVDINQIATDLNGKLDRDLSNIDTGTFDVVVAYQKPTSSNNYTWYRKYASGWVEQGGLSDASSSFVDVTFPKKMANKNYTIVVGNGESTTNADYTAHCGAQSRTVNGFKFYVKGYGGSGTSYRCCWQVSGQGA